MIHAAPAKIPASAGQLNVRSYAYACELAINHAQSCQKQGALQVTGRLRATVFQNPVLVLPPIPAPHVFTMAT